MDFFIIPEIVLTYTIVFSPLILFKHNDGKNRRKIMLKEEIDGVSYVYVPKDLWDRMWEILDRFEELGNKYGKHS